MRRPWIYAATAIVLIATVVAVAFAIIEFGTSRPTPAQLHEALGGERVAAVVRAPQRVEAVLLKTPEKARYFHPHEYALAGEGVTVDPQIASQIGRFVLNPREHWMRDPEAPPVSCYPIYGLRLTYFQGNDRVDLFICFRCSDLAIYSNEELIPPTLVEFDVDELLDEAIAIFPGNAELMELEKRR
jgi:hypothetical protein